MSKYIINFTSSDPNVNSWDDVDEKKLQTVYIRGKEFKEIKRGRWIIDREFGNDVMSGEQMVICSECGKGIFWGKQNYCPNCGASMMDEVEEWANT